MEAFQELRSNLLISLPAGAPAMIAVTSCDPGEGKTSVSTNIAWALAAQDRHVTAIDCDLRKPALHTQMGVPFGPGGTSRRTEDALAPRADDAQPVPRRHPGRHHRPPPVGHRLGPSPAAHRTAA